MAHPASRTFNLLSIWTILGRMPRHRPSTLDLVLDDDLDDDLDANLDVDGDDDV